MENPERINPFTQSGTEDEAWSEMSSRIQPTLSKQQSFYAMNLREFSPLHHLLSVIPTQAQRGLSKFEIDFISLDVHPKWIAIGSSIGTLFLYGRRTGELTRARYQDYLGRITSVRIFSSLELMVAFGTETGMVLACQIVDFNLPAKQLDCFSVTDLHSSSITCLEWSPNGTQIFSGDQSGLVVVTQVEHYESACSSRALLQEQHSVVQLAYHLSSILAISTTHRCIICHIHDGESQRFVQVGSKNRKISSDFGCTFDPISLSTNCLKICTTRPGLRLWKANPEGFVTETLLLKDSCLAANQQPSIQILNPALEGGPSASMEVEQFGQLLIFQDLFLLTWNASAIYIIDPEMRGVVASTGVGVLTNIVDVATSADEVFLLQGKRNIRRLASAPEEDFHFIPVPKEMEGSQFLSNILSPFQDLVKERSASNFLDRFRFKTEKTEEPVAMLSNHVADVPPIVTFSPEQVEVGLDVESLLNGQVTESFSGSSMEETAGKADPTSNDKDSEDELVDSAVVVVVRKSNLSRKKKKKHKMKESGTRRQDYSSPLNEAESSSFQMYSINSVPVLTDRLNEDLLLERILGSFPAPVNSTPSSHGHSKDDSGQPSSDKSPSEQIPLDQLHTSSPGLSSLALKEEPSQGLQLTNSHSERRKETPDPHSPSTPPTGGATAKPPSSKSIASPDPDIYRSSPRLEHPKVRRVPDISKTPESLTEESPEVSPDDNGQEEWVQYKSPSGQIVSMAVSKMCLYVVDSKENLFYTYLKGPGLHWYSLNQAAEQVSVSPSGSLLWVLHKRSAYAVSLSVATGDLKGKWTEAAQRVAHITLDDNCAWFLKDTGDVRVQQGLTPGRPCFKTQNVPFEMGTPLLLSCRAGVLWLLNHKGRLCATSLSNAQSSSKLLNLVWREVIIPEALSVSKFGLGPDGVGWMVDAQGKIWFKGGVTVSRPQGEDTCWQVSVDVATQRMWKSIWSLTECPPLFSVGARGLWIYFGKLLWANRGNTTGHKWDRVNRNSNWISVFASESRQGALWILSQSGELVCLPSYYSKPVTISLQTEMNRGAGHLTCLATAPSSLWALCDSGTVYYRTGIMPPVKTEGTGWARLDLSQIGNHKLIHISCGKDVVWACDSSGCVWVRVGPISPTKQGLEPAWIMVDDVDTHRPALNFLKVCVSGNGLLVWAIERNSHNLYYREGVTVGFPIGRRWTSCPGCQALCLTVSDSSVYAISLYGAIFKRVGIHSTDNPVGTSWKHLLGIPISESISVTASDDLLALDQLGNLQQCVYTTVQHHTAGSIHHPVVLSNAPEDQDVTDEGWEMICTTNS